MSTWKNKIALVTGGSAGLGRSIALALAARGASVAIAARNERRLLETADELSKHGGEVEPVVADVTEITPAYLMVEQVLDRFGRLDVLVNNVGRSTRGKAADAKSEDFQQMLDVNFLSAVNCTKAATAHLIESGGSLVNIGSLAGKTVGPNLGAYPAAKFALSAYTHQLRLELKPEGVHVLLVCPGPIAREDAGSRYDDAAADLSEDARRPGGGVKLRGIDPGRLAEKIVRACERRRGELIVPARARLLLAVSALSPSLGDWIIRRMT